MPDSPAYLPAVKQQYEHFPYPSRNPADESHRLLHAVSGNLLVINHHCFQGRKDFRSGFRVLIAGGGTGDTAIYLAEQLRHHEAEVVYLDMSTASRQIAEARATARKLDNITWVTASIMELPSLGLGQFDYIECCGVLHHLESTEAGLQALNAVLKDDGAIFLMLYGKHGRQDIYDMQSLLRDYLPADMAMSDKVRMTRQLLDYLPKSNTFLRNIDKWGHEISLKGNGDAGLYDLLLHSQDRCFDVPSLYALAQGCGLHLLGFPIRQADYDPLTHISDPAICAHLATLDMPNRHAIAEKMLCNMDKHEFFLARQPDRHARLTDESNALRSFRTLLDNAPKLAASMVPGKSLSYKDGENTLQITCTPISKQIYAHMNGTTSLKELRQHILKTVPNCSSATIDAEMEQIYNQLHPRGYLYLIKAGDYGATVPDYATLR
jgi:ubiquinone/menaquinone biosynthesis C-methylase UbiE/predicted GNAT family acetyltransferase